MAECPGPDCWFCNGEACGKCGAGMRVRVDEPPCEHDVLERHEMTERTFPVLCSDRERRAQRLVPLALRKPQVAGVPWALVAPHEAQALRNHGQSLERLAERGGLSICELVAVLEDRPWLAISEGEAEKLLESAFKNWRDQAREP